MKKLDIVKKHLEELIDGYSKLNEVHRAGSFRKVLEKLEENFSTTDLPTDINSLKSLKGVGDSSIAEIKEVLETGSSVRLVTLRQKLDTTAEVDPNDLKSTLSSLLK